MHNRVCLSCLQVGQRNPKPEILDRIAKVLGVRSEYLSASAFGNYQEAVFALLENRDISGYTVRNTDGEATIARSLRERS